MEPDTPTSEPSWWWDEVMKCQMGKSLGTKDSTSAVNKAKSEDLKSKDSIWLDKLRWDTLGYHHNWDTKKYSMKSVSGMPTDLIFGLFAVSHFQNHSKKI